MFNSVFLVLLLNAAPGLAPPPSRATEVVVGYPAQIVDIVDAVLTCSAAVTPKGGDQTRLTAAGWQLVRVSNAADIPVFRDQFTSYYKRGDSHIELSLTLGGPANGVCQIRSSVESEESFEQLEKALTSRFARSPGIRTSGRRYWSRKTASVMLDAERIDGRPGVRLMMIY